MPLDFVLALGAVETYLLRYFLTYGQKEGVWKLTLVMCVSSISILVILVTHNFGK